MKEPQKRLFRFERGDVRLLSMIEEDGIPWEDIEERHLSPKRTVIVSTSGSLAAEFVLDVAAGIVSGLIVAAITGL